MTTSSVNPGIAMEATCAMCAIFKGTLAIFKGTLAINRYIATPEFTDVTVVKTFQPEQVLQKLATSLSVLH